MNTKAVAGLLLWGVFSVVGAQASTGSLRGKVMDHSGSVGFEGALIYIPSLGLQAVTGRDGSYRFAQVPVGEHEVIVEYLGASGKRQSIRIGDGASAELSFRIGEEVLPIENILVIGQAAGQAGALNRQRNADNIQNVVSADAIGQFPDQNVAEALQRVSGLSLQRDQGEGRFVTIRGIDSALTSTTINGVRVPAPEDDTRQVNLDVISSDLLESLEVTKTVTPDMDADSVGGNVELKSATAFDRGNSLNVRAESSYNDQSEQWSPKLAVGGTGLLSLGEGVENLGVAAAISWFDRDFASDNLESDGFEDIQGPDGEFRGLEQAEQRDYRITRQRLSTTFNLDYKPGPDTDIYWHTLFSEFSDDEVQLSNVFKYNADEVQSLSRSSASFADSETEKLNEARKETQEIFSTVIGAENHLGSFTTDYALAYAFANEDNPNALGATFVSEPLVTSYALNRRQTPRLFSNDAAFSDPATYTLDEIVFEDSFTEERETALSVNLKRDIMFSRRVPGYWKIGAKSRLREKQGDKDNQTFDGFGQDVTLADFPNQNVDYPFGSWGPIQSREALRSFFNANRDNFELDDDTSLVDSTLEDYNLEENVYAGYVMARADLGATRIVGGIRVERTDYDVDGKQLVIDQENGDGAPEFTALRDSKTYTEILPSIHLRHAFSERMILRGGLSRTLARPSFEQAAARTAIEIEDDDGEFERKAEFGNPDLDPLSADNIDLLFEYYPGGVTLLSAGIFYKRIEDFFVISDVAGEPGPFENFDEAFTTLNGESADLFGAEFAYSQKFAFLPSPMDGALISANLTLTDSEATLAFRPGGAPLPRQSDTIANLVLGWEKYGASIRLAANYRSEFLDEINALDDPTLDRYEDRHLQIDLIASYWIADNYQIYFNGVNLNDEPLYAYFQDDRFNSQYEEYGPTYELGLKANF